jgi:hypothetical protein
LHKEPVDMTCSRALDLLAESGTAGRFMEPFTDSLASLGEVTLPGFTPEGFLPPYYQHEGKERTAPYRISVNTLSQVFGFNERRQRLLSAFAEYRQYIRDRGIQGAAWIGGSFTTLKEHPSDIDVTIFFQAPVGPFPWHSEKTSCRPTMLSRVATRGQFGCDVFFVDIRADRLRLARAAGLWHGQFSGNFFGVQRGFLEIAL